METFATPKEVYEMHTEAQTMHHIEQMEGNIEAQRMQVNRFFSPFTPVKLSAFQRLS